MFETCRHTLGILGEQNHLDLLTVLAHAIGHLLGQEHQADGVMAETLSAGTRGTVNQEIDTNATGLAGAAFFAWYPEDEQSLWMMGGRQKK